jgi:hypothetical protein
MINKLLPHAAHLLVGLKKTIPAVLLLGTLSLATAPVALAQISITISPVGLAATATQFSVTASGPFALDGAFASNAFVIELDRDLWLDPANEFISSSIDNGSGALVTEFTN